MKKFNVTIDGITTEVFGNSQQHAIRQMYHDVLDIKSGESMNITVQRLPYTKADATALANGTEQHHLEHRITLQRYATNCDLHRRGLPPLVGEESRKAAIEAIEQYDGLMGSLESLGL